MAAKGFGLRELGQTDLVERRSEGSLSLELVIGPLVQAKNPFPYHSGSQVEEKQSAERRPKQAQMLVKGTVPQDSGFSMR